MHNGAITSNHIQSEILQAGMESTNLIVTHLKDLDELNGLPLKIPLWNSESKEKSVRAESREPKASPRLSLLTKLPVRMDAPH